MNILKTILFITASVFILNTVQAQNTVEPEKEEIIEDVEEVATFPGGTTAYIEFIQNNLNYPKAAIRKNRQGKCYITMLIDKEGNVSEARVVKGVPKCPECDAEALRVVYLMPRWIPGKFQGKPVKCRFQIPISFKLT